MDHYNDHNNDHDDDNDRDLGLILSPAPAHDIYPGAGAQRLRPRQLHFWITTTKTSGPDLS